MNDSVLASVSSFTVGYTRKFSNSYQAWNFSHSETVSFLPEHDLAARRALVQQAYALCKWFVKEDMKNTIPDIEAELGPELGNQLRTVWGSNG